MAASSDEGSCSGRLTRSKNRDTGRNTSLTDTSYDVRVLQLLQHRARHPGGEHVARQQQHRQPVHRGQRGSGDHVRRAGPDRGGAGQRREPVAHPRVAGRGVHHALLVARLVVGQRARPPASSASSSACPTPATLPCPKMPKQPANSRCSTPSRSLRWAARKRTSAWATVSRTVVIEPSPGVNGSRGSTAWAAQVSRTQAWAGSSQISQARSPRAGHHVEVVQVVAGRRHRRPVPAVRHQHDVTRCAPRRARRPVAPATRRRPAGSRSRPRTGDLEVVDLLELGLDCRRRRCAARRACAAGTTTSCRRG